MMNVLITYYTKTNTTKEICEYIGEKLTSRGNNVTIISIEQILSSELGMNMLDSYDEIIIGAPINGMNWAPDAKTFVDKNMSVLMSKQIAIFFDAYLIDNSYGFWTKIIKKSLKKYEEALKPVAVGKFGGRVDKAFSGVPKLLFGSKKHTPLDRRDWVEIDRFVEKL